MKKALLVITLLLLAASVVSADVIVLDTPESLSVPTAPRLVWDEIRINNQGKILRVFYHWENADGTQIRNTSGRTQNIWRCFDRAEIPAFDVGTCIDIDDPHPCCTGAGTGTGCPELVPAVTCFTDTFGFTIRQVDVDTKLGLGLRALIWSKMKDDILTPGNDGTFQ